MNVSGAFSNKNTENLAFTGRVVLCSKFGGGATVWFLEILDDLHSVECTKCS